jgi:hypothetical protein
MSAFCPNGSTVALSVTSGGGSFRAALPALDSVCGAIRIRKGTGDPEVFIKFGDSSISASTSDMPVGTETQIFKVPPGATHVAGIGGTASVYFTAGQI